VVSAKGSVISVSGLELRQHSWESTQAAILAGMAHRQSEGARR
jgi:hypothetical protein